MEEEEKIVKQLLAETPFEIVATAPALPGWHVVWVEDTGLSDPSDPDAALGKTFQQVLVLPLKHWGFVCPPDLYQAPSQKPLKAEGFDAIMQMLREAMPKALSDLRSQYPMLPLDSRTDPPKLVPLETLVGVYPPSEGDAHAVLKKAEALIRERSEKELKKRRAAAHFEATPTPTVGQK